MKSNEKLDFLMKLTNTSNSTLGKQLTFDASYISRIRSGKRNMPQNEIFLGSVASFFTDRIQNPYQKKLASDLICGGNEWPDNQLTAQQMILRWLSMQNVSTPIGGLLTGIAAIRSTSLPATALPPVLETVQQEQVRFFYGDSGKRDAVAQFLSELGQMDHPPQLLLYSNEEFNWMYEDPAFAKKWAMLLITYIKKGGHIKIAHTISRASGEMLVALQKWIPVYMTGAIEPYYYPKILDRIFRKTLFIAEGHSAIVGSSVGSHTEHGMNSLIYDVDAVHAVEQEFWEFFSLCKPLMQIYNIAGRERFLDYLKQFHGVSENTVTVRTTPSFYTMPEHVARQMTERLDRNWIAHRRELGQADFRDLMDNGNTLTEILNLPPIESVCQGEIAFPMCDLFDKPGLYYTLEEFADHLQAVVDYMRKYDQYQVILSASIPENEIIYVKEDLGVILVKSDAPTIAFTINEQRMVSAFWDYLGEMSDRNVKKEKTIAKLEAYITKLRACD